MTSMAPMRDFKDSLFALSGTNLVEDYVEQETWNHVSSEFVQIDNNKLIEFLFNDELKPRNQEIYDQLCTALIVENSGVSHLFQYEEIEYSNRDAFFGNCDMDDLLAFAVLLISVYISYVNPTAVLKYTTLHPNYRGEIYTSNNLQGLLKNYTDRGMQYYPGVFVLEATNATLVMDELEIIKDLLTVVKVDTMNLNNKSVVNSILNNIVKISLNEIKYDDGRVLNTSSFKDSEIAACKFLYHITRNGAELNSVQNIKAIFENLKEMVKSGNTRNLKHLFEKFLYYNKDASSLIVAYMQRLAALNKESLSDKENLVSITFDYDSSDLFTIFAEKAA